MGATTSVEEDAKETITEELEPENGLILSRHHIPQEVLGHILSFVDADDLALRCRLVCEIWRETVQNFAMKRKAEQLGVINFKENPSLSQRVNWVDYYKLISRKPLGDNLLRNNCGQNGLKAWEILSNGGDGWATEPTPYGTEGLPPVNARGESHPDFCNLSSCFATSYYSCTKQQLINLRECGLTDNFMDNIQPPIEISEWAACRFDCGCVYELKVSLLNRNKQLVSDFSARENFSHLPRERWFQVKHIFKNYGPGVRYVLFYHSGMDSQFWKGHYGSKMSGGVVRPFATLKYSITQ